MPEKEVWTTDGRKKTFLVDDENMIINELRDLGPLSELEFQWVKSNPTKPYSEWLKELEEEGTEGNEENEGNEKLEEEGTEGNEGNEDSIEKIEGDDA